METPPFTWKTQWFFICLQVVSIAWATVWYFDIPHPGYSIALLAVVAAAMSIHPDMHGWQKGLWLLIMGAFLLVEFHALDKDRTENDATRSRDRKEDTDRFGRIAKGLETAITNSQVQFAATLSRIEGVGGIAKKALIVSTGDGSYVTITGLKQSPRDSNSLMELVISNPTNIVAKDVGISVFPSFVGDLTKIPDDPRFTYRTLGDVPPGIPPIYSDILVPPGNYEIWINSASGMFWEYLQMSKCKNGNVPSLVRVRAVNSKKWLRDDSTIKPCPD
jgi:hypothetical protein